MKHNDLEESLHEKFRKDMFEPREERSLEDAIQEALDQTTPELPGDPRDRDDTQPRRDRDGWA